MNPTVQIGTALKNQTCADRLINAEHKLKKRPTRVRIKFYSFGAKYPLRARAV
jgi:hypothetical protein